MTALPAPRSLPASAGLASDGKATPRSLGSSIVPLLLISLMLCSGTIMSGVFSTVQEGAKAELRLTDFDLGLIQGLAPALGLAILSVPLGLLIDRSSRVRLLILLSTLWTLGTVLTAYATSFPMLFAARLMTGLGAMSAVAAAISVGADLCRPAQRGRAMLILTIGRQGGAAAAFGLGGWLFGIYASGGIAGLSPWRSVHLALAIVAAIMTVVLLLLREPARQEVAAGPNPPVAVVAQALWARRGFILPLFIGQVSVVMADMAAGIWAAPVLSRSFGLSPAEFGGWMGAVIFGSVTAGSILGGFAADLGHRSGRRGGILIGAVIASGLAAPAALFPIMPGTTGFAIALGALLLGGTITGLITATALSVLLPNELRGLCLGLFIAVAGVIALGIAPPLVTWVSTLLGGEALLATALAIVGTAVSTLSFLAFCLAMRNAPRSA